MRTLHRILLAGAALGFQASAQGRRAAPSKFLCDEGGFICVPASAHGALIRNPLRLPVYVKASDHVELTWKITDSTGKLIDKNTSEDRMDWNGGGVPIQDTFHILDFILTPADSDTGTMTISPILVHFNVDSKPLPPLSFPVRLTTARGLVTIREPRNPDAFQDEVYEWVDSEFPKPDFRSKLPFKSTRVQVMRFDSGALIGITAAAVISRYPGQSMFYVTDWSPIGDTVHVGIDGGGWAGVSHYSTMLYYIVEQSLLALPGIKHVK